MPDRADHERRGEPGFRAAPEDALVWLPDGSRLRVQGGREIVLDDRGTGGEAFLRLVTLNVALTLALHQRGTLVLHAMAAVVGDKAVAVLGTSGAGKSALAAELGRRGHAILTDEVCAVDTDGLPTVHAGPRCLQLWPDVMALHGLAGVPVRWEGGKEYVPLGPASSAPLERVIELGVGHAGAPIEVPALGVVPLLLRHIHRREYLEGLGRGKQVLEACVQVAKYVSGARILRDLDRPVGESLVALADRIEDLV